MLPKTKKQCRRNSHDFHDKKSSIVAQHVELNNHVTPTMADILVVLPTMWS